MLDGECIEISTGAPMPDGADAVVMVEETDRAPMDSRDLCRSAAADRTSAARGADIRSGQVVVSSGETLNSSRVGALAAIGTSAVEVYERPRVAILSTGNEVVEPGQATAAGSDLRHQPFHDLGGRLGQRRHSGAVSAGARFARRASSRRSTTASSTTSSCSRVAARSESAT